MSGIKYVASLILLLLFTTIVVDAVNATELDTWPLGSPYSSVISFGDEYTSSVELYDISITVEKVIRGKPALEVLQSSDPDIKPPADGMEYLLTRIKFEYRARSIPGDRIYQLRKRQFTAVAIEGKKYQSTADIIIPPDLDQGLQAPDTAEGWIVYCVNPGDKKLKLVFHEETDNTLHRGDGMWFSLYK